MTKSIREKLKLARPETKSSLGFTNDFQVPKLVKVAISSGTGKAKDKKRNELVADRLGKITGQKPAFRGAKKSVASFKVRQGDIVGVAVTLRGEQMYGFLDKLINVAFPRTRDFKGFSLDSIDDMGNLTIGIKEHTIFPEVADEEIKDVFSLAITIVTTARNKAEAKLLFESIGWPFKK